MLTVEENLCIVEKVDENRQSESFLYIGKKSLKSETTVTISIPILFSGSVFRSNHCQDLINQNSNIFLKIVVY